MNAWIIFTPNEGARALKVLTQDRAHALKEMCALGIALPPKGEVEVSSRTERKAEKFKNPCEGVMAVIFFSD
jgi:hypothetical protein